MKRSIVSYLIGIFVVFAFLGTSIVQAQEHPGTNILFILDCSGSMDELMDEGTRFDVAREVLLNRLEEIQVKQVSIAVRVFGSKGGYCGDTELLLPFTRIQDIDLAATREVIQSLEPIGHQSPLAGALSQANGDFAAKEGENNWVILLTDGLENCGGNPSAVAEELFSSDIKVKTHIIGMGIDDDGLADLSSIVAPSGGLVLNAETASELFSNLEEAVEVTYQYNLRFAVVDKNGKSINCTLNWQSPDGDIPYCLALIDIPGWWHLKLLPGHYLFEVRNNKTGEVKVVSADLYEDEVEEIVVEFEQGSVIEYVYEPYGVVRVNVADNSYENVKFTVVKCINGTFQRHKLYSYLIYFCSQCQNYTQTHVSQFAEFIAPPGTHEFCVYNRTRDEARYFTITVASGKAYVRDVTF